MPKAKAKKPETLAEKFQRCLRAREQGKKMYARSDKLLSELLMEVEPGEEVKLNESGKTARIVDNFAEKTQVFHGSYCRRFEIEVSDN